MINANIKATPADFAVIAATAPKSEICAHYGIGDTAVTLMIASMPHEWRKDRLAALKARKRAASPRKACPVNFRAVAMGETENSLSVVLGVSNSLTARWLSEQDAEWRAEWRKLAKAKAKEKCQVNARKASKAAALKPKVSMIKAAPVDVYFDFLAMSIGDVSRKHKVGYDTASGWRRDMTDEQRANIQAKIDERKRAAGLGALAFAAEKRRSVAKSKPATVKTPGKPSGKHWGFNKPTDVAPAPGGIEYEAARFLMRRNSVVCRGETISPALKGYWIVGARPAMMPSEMLALARAGGFNPDAWRQVAA